MSLVSWSCSTESTIQFTIANPFIESHYHVWAYNKEHNQLFTLETSGLFPSNNNLQEKLTFLTSSPESSSSTSNPPTTVSFLIFCLFLEPPFKAKDTIFADNLHSHHASKKLLLKFNCFLPLKVLHNPNSLLLLKLVLPELRLGFKHKHGVEWVSANDLPDPEIVPTIMSWGFEKMGNWWGREQRAWWLNLLLQILENTFFLGDFMLFFFWGPNLFDKGFFF